MAKYTREFLEPCKIRIASQMRELHFNKYYAILGTVYIRDYHSLANVLGHTNELLKSLQGDDPEIEDANDMSLFAHFYMSYGGERLHNETIPRHPISGKRVRKFTQLNVADASELGSVWSILPEGPAVPQERPLSDFDRSPATGQTCVNHLRQLRQCKKLEDQRGQVLFRDTGDGGNCSRPRDQGLVFDNLAISIAHFGNFWNATPQGPGHSWGSDVRQNPLSPHDFAWRKDDLSGLSHPMMGKYRVASLHQHSKRLELVTPDLQRRT